MKMVWMNEGFHEMQEGFMSELRDLENVRAIFNKLPVKVRKLQADKVDISTYVGHPTFRYHFRGQETRDEKASEAVALLMKEGFAFTSDYTLYSGSDNEDEEKWARVGEMLLGEMEYADWGKEPVKAEIRVQVQVTGFSRPIGYQVKRRYSPGYSTYSAECNFKGGA